MSNEAVKESSDGSLNEAGDGSVYYQTDVTVTADCYCQACYGHLGGVLRPWPAPNGDLLIWGGRHQCHRLFVWERRTVAANVFGGASAPDYQLKSTFGARNQTGTFFETFEGSGIDLDDEPYWWRTCNRGGYETVTVGSHWYEPTLAACEAFRTGTLDDGIYTKLVVVQYRHLGGLNPGDPDVVPENDGFVRIVGHYSLKHC